MRRTVEGVFRNGRIELRETPDSAADGAPVLVTFLPPGPANLDEHGIGLDAAAELRARLAAFADEWESPEMDIYDDYDTALSPASASTGSEVDAVWSDLDRWAAEIGARWPSEVTAVDAVVEGRRDL